MELIIFALAMLSGLMVGGASVSLYQPRNLSFEQTAQSALEVSNAS